MRTGEQRGQENREDRENRENSEDRRTEDSENGMVHYPFPLPVCMQYAEIEGIQKLEV